MNLIIKGEVDSVEFNSNIENRFLYLLDYFDLSNKEINVEVILWSELEEFRSFASEKLSKSIPHWMCGWTSKVDNKYIIHTLSLKELKKCKSHENNDIKDLENIIVHEFVHVLVKIVSCKKVNKWLTESLAVSLASQSHKYNFNYDLENLINDNFIDYGMFQLIGDYLVNKKGNDYVIKLVKDKVFLETELVGLYKEIKDYYGG